MDGNPCRQLEIEKRWPDKQLIRANYTLGKLNMHLGTLASTLSQRIKGDISLNPQPQLVF